MRTHFTLAIAFLVVGLIGCAQSKRACLVKLAETNVSCMDFVGSLYLASQTEIDTICTAASGTLGASCPTTDSYGKCAVASGTANEITYRFYGGSSSTQELSCVGKTGTWTAN